VELVSARETSISRIIRVRLRYDRPAPAAPPFLILKTRRPGSVNTPAAAGSTEIDFYQRIAPSLPAGVAPLCFEAQQGDATHPWHLLLEDLTATHMLATEWPLPLRICPRITARSTRSCWPLHRF
jgi:hypothetical protein